MTAFWFILAVVNAHSLYTILKVDTRARKEGIKIPFLMHATKIFISAMITFCILRVLNEST